MRLLGVEIPDFRCGAPRPAMRGAFRLRHDDYLWRRVVSALMLASFFWISYASQTHIHGQPGIKTVAATTAKSLSSAHGGATSNRGDRSDDPENCALCQAASLTGVAIMPLLMASLLIRIFAAQVSLQQSVAFRPNPLGMGHQTRGPPAL